MDNFPWQPKAADPQAPNKPPEWPIQPHSQMDASPSAEDGGETPKPAEPVMMNDLLVGMLTRDASDLFVSSGARPQYSINGEMVDVSPALLTPVEARCLAESIMTDKQKVEFDAEKELNFSLTLGEEGRFRVNIFLQRGSVALVVRRIKVSIPHLEELGLPETLGNLLLQERGLILMTGPTGSGKSTTLAAMIDYRNESKGGHIITIEDPIEFMYTNKKALINQREVGLDTKSFHIALKNTLRQAPKVIYIGEIRDAETMEFSLHAAETGHLVLATLHANSANQTLERILNFVAHEYHPQILLQLSLTLRAILSQRLIPKINGGRVPALEVLLNTPFISELICKGKIAEIKTAMSQGKEGTQTFDQDLFRLWHTGQISEEDAIQFSDSPTNLRLCMRGLK